MLLDLYIVFKTQLLPTRSDQIWALKLTEYILRFVFMCIVRRPGRPNTNPKT